MVYGVFASPNMRVIRPYDKLFHFGIPRPIIQVEAINFSTNVELDMLLKIQQRRSLGTRIIAQ